MRDVGREDQEPAKAVVLDITSIIQNFVRSRYPPVYLGLPTLVLVRTASEQTDKFLTLCHVIVDSLHLHEPTNTKQADQPLHTTISR